MEKLRFGTFCDQLVKFNAELSNNKQNRFSTDYACYNEILYIISRQTTNSLEKKYDTSLGYQVPSSRISELKSGEKNLLRQLTKFLLDDDREHRIKVIKAGLFFLKREHFPCITLANRLIKAFKQSHYDINDLNSNSIGESYLPTPMELETPKTNNKAIDILAKLLYFVSAFVPNLSSNDGPKKLPLKLHIEDVNTKMIQNGQYFQSLTRNILISPNKQANQLTIKTTTHYKSPLISPKFSDPQTFFHTFEFDNEAEHQNHQMVSLIINDIDYSNCITVTDQKSPFSNYPYKRSYSVKDIPYHSTYNVEMIIQSTTDTPIYQTSYRLKVPCQNFFTNVKVVGKENNEFKVTFNIFSPLSHNKCPNYINSQPDGNMVSLGLFNWLPKGAGYSLNIHPKYNYWEQYIDQN